MDHSPRGFAYLGGGDDDDNDGGNDGGVGGFKTTPRYQPRKRRH